GRTPALPGRPRSRPARPPVTNAITPHEPYPLSVEACERAGVLLAPTGAPSFLPTYPSPTRPFRTQPHTRQPFTPSPRRPAGRAGPNRPKLARTGIRRGRREQPWHRIVHPTLGSPGVHSAVHTNDDRRGVDAYILEEQAQPGVARRTLPRTPPFRPGRVRA